jgi:DNA-binding PucR family transcriptional regulator
MKKSIFTLAIAMLIAGTIFTGCQSSATKVENAEEKLQAANDKVSDAKQDLLKARLDSINDYEQFKKETEEILITHRKSIADFKARIENEKSENKAKYEKKLAELDKKNTDLEKTLEAYKENGKENWQSFKTKFIYDMQELTEAFKELTAINAK